MIELKGVLSIEESLNGNLNLGVDYYKGDKGDDGYTPIKGKDYFTQEEIEKVEQDTIDKISTDGFAKSADLADVATSGSYKDLKDKPEPIDLTSYPTKDEVEQSYVKKADLPEPYELPVASDTVLGGVKIGSGLSINQGVLSANGGGVADSVDWSKVQNKPDFATVATSGDYNDLSNKPSIPSVDGLVSKDYVDQKVESIEIPTKVSAFENDKGYLTEHQSLADYALKSEIPNTTNLATKNEVQEVGNKIPTVKIDPNNHVYQINNKEIGALYDGVGNTINSTYASKAELTGVENKIPDVSGFVTMTAVESKGYQTETQVNNLINQALGVIENGTY